MCVREGSKSDSLIRVVLNENQYFNISKFEIYEFMNFGISKSVVIVQTCEHLFIYLFFRNAELSQDVLLPAYIDHTTLQLHTAPWQTA